MSRRAGFTLVEILIAMAIFLFGVTAVLGLLLASYSTVMA